MECDLAEAMGECELAEGLTATARSPAATWGTSVSTVENEAATARILTHDPPAGFNCRRGESGRNVVADIVDRIFHNVYSKIETSEVLAGLGQLRVVHAPTRQGRTATSHGAVRKERRATARRHVGRTSMRETEAPAARTSEPSSLHSVRSPQ